MTPIFSRRFVSILTQAGLAMSLLVSPLAIRNAPAQSPSLNPGPRSQTEADFLFKDAAENGSQGKVKEEIRELERFKNRYPSDPRIESVYLKLLSDYKTENNQSLVISTAKEALLLKLSNDTKHQVKIFSASALLAKLRYADASIQAEEVIKDSPSEANLISASLIKLSALTEQHKFKDAKSVLDALRSQKTADTDPELKTQLQIQDVQISLGECGTLTLPAKVKEDDLLTYAQKKSLCLREIFPRLASLEANPEQKKQWCETYDRFFSKLLKASDSERGAKYLKQKLTQDYAHPAETVDCHEPSAPRQK
jgi:hypothetical protein